jgi:hypothetical protein
MEDGELSEEDSDLAEMALRQGLSIEEMRLKMDAELGGVKKEDAEDVSFRPLICSFRSSPVRLHARACFTGHGIET